MYCLCSQGISIGKVVSLCQSLCLKEKFYETSNNCFQKWKRVPKQIENISLMQYPQLFICLAVLLVFCNCASYLKTRAWLARSNIFAWKYRVCIFNVILYLNTSKKCNLLNIMILSLPPKLQKAEGKKVIHKKQKLKYSVPVPGFLIECAVLKIL